MSNTGIPRERVAALTRQEIRRFAEGNPKSRNACREAEELLLWGVPMVWQAGIEGPFSLFMESGRGNRVRDLDGHDYLDLSMGVYATLGHADPRYLEPLMASMRKGLQHQCPSLVALDVARELNRRLGNYRWNFSLNGTDANRWAIRLARHLTGRPKVLVPNYAYHGTVEEVQVIRHADGTVGYYDADVGTPPARAGERTRIVEYNDLEGLEQALSHGDIAVVLMEPVMTNIGLVLPDPGYHDGVRALTRQYGALLLIDETHTMWSGPSGLTGRWGLEPDIWTAGKIIGGGVPAGVYGFRADLGEQLSATLHHSGEGLVGIGGTFSGGALSLHGIHANLTHMMTPENFALVETMGSRACQGLQAVINDFALPWHVGERLGARVTYHFSPGPCCNMTDYVESVHDDDLTYLLNLSLLNRGVMAMAFNNCWMISPHCKEADIDYALAAFRDCCEQLIA